MAMARNVVGCLAVAAMLMAVAKAATYTVGDTDGWSSGTDYTTWLSGKTFKVGDKLVFTYLPNHDVLEVSKPDYDSCTTSSPISSDNSGSTTITLTAVGKRYFICGTIGHCQQGMQLEVDTSASSSSPPPPAATSPPPPSSPKTPPPKTPPPAAAPPPTSTPQTPPPTSTPQTPPPTTPKAGSPPPSDSKVTPPPPPPSSAFKVSHGASFAFALLMLAVI